IGATETLLLVSRYLDTMAMAIGRSISSYPIRRLLFRCLYYTRRDGTRSDKVAAAERQLRGRLPRRWYFIMWAIHRLTKPFGNLARRLSPPRGPARRAAPDAAAVWRARPAV